jgi:hypothetical protein
MTTGIRKLARDTGLEGGLRDTAAFLKALVSVDKDQQTVLRYGAVVATIIVYGVGMVFWGDQAGAPGVGLGFVIAMVNTTFLVLALKDWKARRRWQALLMLTIWFFAAVLSMTAGMGKFGGRIAERIRAEDRQARIAMIQEGRLGEATAGASQESPEALQAQINAVLARTVETKRGPRTVGFLTNGGQTCVSSKMSTADACTEIADLKARKAEAEQRRKDEDALAANLADDSKQSGDMISAALDVWSPLGMKSKLATYYALVMLAAVFVDLMSSFLPWTIARQNPDNADVKPERTIEDIDKELAKPGLTPEQEARLKRDRERLLNIQKDFDEFKRHRDATETLFKF